MSERENTIPFELQSDPQARRDCGAACLRMVYSSFGQDIPQAEIWPLIAKENRFGSVASTTHLMAKDALSRGFDAVVFQARHPLQALRLCGEPGTRAILNHRPTHESPTGHYSVLVEMNDQDVVLHDPFYGPSRRVPHADLLELWKPLPPNSEIGGYILICIASKSPAPTSCWLCRAPIPLAVACPACKQEVSVQPSGPLGCVDSSCLAHMWNYICCPFCDRGFAINAQAVTNSPIQLVPPDPGSPRAQAPTVPRAAPLDFTRLFAEVDKFCSYILTIPGAVDHPRIKKQLEFIASSKEKLKLGAAESAVRHKAHQEQLVKMMQTAKQNQEAHCKKLEELNTPSAPLDGDALGNAFMKTLGFIH